MSQAASAASNVYAPTFAAAPAIPTPPTALSPGSAPPAAGINWMIVGGVALGVLAILLIRKK